MIRIAKWYPATLLIVLFSAIAVGWQRIPRRWERWAMVLLLACTLLGFFLFSPAPLGGRFEPELYRVSQRDRLASQMIESIPPEAKVAVQGAYVPHLTDHADLYQYPWIKIGKENIDYFLLDRQIEPYPFDKESLNAEITNMVADPRYIVAEDADGIYLIRQASEQLPAFPVDKIAQEAIHLERIEVAVRDQDSLFHPLVTDTLPLHPGQQLRVTLYWEALENPEADQTVSVRLADETGWLIAQHDSIPVGGSRPTSWWEKGQKIRDVYYLAIPPEVTPGSYSLDLVLYDTYTQEIAPFAGEGDVLELRPVVIGE